MQFKSGEPSIVAWVEDDRQRETLRIEPTESNLTSEEIPVQHVADDPVKRPVLSVPEEAPIPIQPEAVRSIEEGTEAEKATEPDVSEAIMPGQVQTEALRDLPEQETHGLERIIPDATERPDVLEAFQSESEVIGKINAEPLDAEIVQAELPFLDSSEHISREVEDEIENGIEATETMPIFDQLMIQIEAMEDTPKAREAQAIVAMLPIVLHEYLQEADPEKHEVLGQEFEVYCERLLVCLLDKENVEPELVKRFARLLAKDYVIHLQKQDAPFMDFMHERRSFINDVIQDIEETLHPILPWLARIAVRDYVVN